MDLIINEEISATQRKLSPEEYSQLEANILADKIIRDPLVIWKGKATIVDGENRYRIHKKHGVPFKHPPTELDFPDIESVFAWIDSNQAGRRNLDGMQMNMVRARMFARTGSAKTVAEVFDVTTRQVYRDAEIANALKDLPEDLRERAHKGELVASGRAMETFAKLDPVAKDKVASALRKDRTKSLNEVLPTKKPAISEEDREVLRETLSPESLQKIALKHVNVEHKDVKRFAALDPVSKEAVDDVLKVPGIKDLGEAIDTLAPKGKRIKVPVDCDKLRQRIADTFASLRRLVDDLGMELRVSVEPVQDALKIAESNLP